MSQVKPLGVFPGVEDHPHPSHKVDQLLPRRVEQVVPALMAAVPVDPLQPQLTPRRRFIRHGGPDPTGPVPEF